jgi:formate dehydrogenase maturation protein FdhE
MLTEEEKIEYIEGGFNYCPYCGSGDLEGGSVVIEENIASQRMTCSECNRKWYNSYVLIDIVEIPDEDPDPENEIDSI